MSPVLVLVTILCYFLMLFTVSYITGRKSDNQGFFIGNRKSPWYIVAFAMIGASLSGVTFVSVPGMVGVNSFAYIQMVLGFIVGQLIIAYVLTPLYYRMNLISIYEYLENRFGTSSHKTGSLVLFHLKDVRGSSKTVSRLPDSADAGVHAATYLFRCKCSHLSHCSLALYLPKWCKITHLDRFIKDIVSYHGCCPLHILYCQQSAS
jgi:hypothetical protein